MGYVYLYTGDGGGKTTNALGLALRSVGHRRRVVIVQFMKWWKNIGEYRVRKRLEPYYIIRQFGRKGWHGLGNLGEEDKRLARSGLRFAEEAVHMWKPHLLVLDEVNLAVYCRLLDAKDVIALLDSVPPETDVVLTGRFASKELIDRADVVNEINTVKVPKEYPTTKGIQY